MKKTMFILPMLAILMLAGIVEGLTIVTPTASQYLNGTFNFTVTTALSNVSPMNNCTFATTADGVFATSYNMSVNQTSWWNSSNTASLTDVASTTLTVICYMSATNETATRTIGIDNTAPTAKLSISRDTIEALKPLETDCSGSSDAIDTSLTYNQTLYNPDGLQIGATCTTSICDWDDGNLEDLGENNISCRVRDDAGNLATTSTLFTVKGRDGAKEIVITKTQRDTTNNTLLILVLLGAVITVIIIVVVLTKKK